MFTWPPPWWSWTVWFDTIVSCLVFVGWLVWVAFSLLNSRKEDRS